MKCIKNIYKYVKNLHKTQIKFLSILTTIQKLCPIDYLCRLKKV